MNGEGMNREHTVLLVHGIRTQAEYQQRVADALEEDPTIRVVPTRYGFFDVLRFLGPRALRRRPVARIARLIRDERRNGRTRRISVIAHSFGTWIISQILESEPDIEFFRLILCGSVIPDDFGWDEYAHRLTAEQPDWKVVNDCGMKDVWPVLAQSLTWGYGASGRFGFGHTRVRDRFHVGGHSDFFTAEFAKQYWRPFLLRGEVVRGSLDRPVTPWWLSALTVFKLKYVAVSLVAVLAAFLVREGMTAQRPTSVPVVDARPPRMLDATLTLFKTVETVSNKRKVCTRTFQTPNLHNVACNDAGDACTSDGKWALQRIALELQPNQNYALSGEMSIECDDNRGSCGWNEAGNVARWNFSQNSPARIVGDRTWGSHSIGLRLCATEGQVHSSLERAEEPRKWKTAEGEATSLDVPEDRIGKLSVMWPDGFSETIQLPGNSKNIRCSGATDTGAGTYRCVATRADQQQLSR